MILPRRLAASLALVAILTTAGVASAGPASAVASPATLALRGEAGQSVTLTAADLSALPRAKVSLTHEGRTTVFEGARMDAVLAKVAAPLGAAMKGSALAIVMVVRASDGYRVALALSDVDPAIRRGAVILADRGDGRPLETGGPYRLVVEGDLKPARAAHSVVEIDLSRLP